MTTRVAIIGTGGIANAHVQAWAALGDRVDPVAAVDLDAERVAAFAAAHRIPHGYTSVPEMFVRERPDLVHIATPPATHQSLIVEALAAGAHVMCEKPLCASLQDLDAIVAAECQTGRSCVSVVQWRFGSAARRVREMIDGERFGRHTVSSCQTTWYRDAAYYAVPWRGTWASEVGGASTGLGIHIIDLMLSLNTDWTEVTAIAETVDRDIEVEDVAVAMVRFADGSLGSVVSSALSPRQETRLRLDFQRATVEVTGLYGYGNGDWTLSALPGHDDALAGWPPPDDIPSGHAAQLRALLDALDADGRPPADATEIRPTIAFLSALYLSARNGRPVASGEIIPGHPSYEHLSGQAVTSG